jgi:bifunctional UDP-N-acetylglucosamine pyrophosphorylase/glucosamine-1-phosphate N-acetyltransferase
VIMVAGLGTRLRPLTDTMPKPMLRVHGRPILEWSIDALPPEVTTVVLVVGYLADQIKAHFGTEWHGRHIAYVQQDTLAGTAMAPHIAKAALAPGRFLALNGDDLYEPADIVRLAAHERAVLVLARREPGRFSCMSANNAGQLCAIQEGCTVDHVHHINTGAYVLDDSYFALPPVAISATEFGLPHTLAATPERSPVDLVEGTWWFPIGYPSDLETATHLLEQHRLT